MKGLKDSFGHGTPPFLPHLLVQRLTALLPFQLVRKSTFRNKSHYCLRRVHEPRQTFLLRQQAAPLGESPSGYMQQHLFNTAAMSFNYAYSFHTFS
jgi:hypothetical protein